MKLRYFPTIAIFLCSIGGFAQSLSVSSSGEFANSLTSATICYQSDVEETALQMILALPSDVTLRMSDITKHNAIKDHEVEWRELPNNRFLCVIYSMDNKKIENGELLSLPIEVPDVDGVSYCACVDVKVANVSAESMVLRSAYFYLGLGDPDGINEVREAQEVQGPVFNLAGQRLQKMQKGINIVGGKKVLK